MINPVKTIGLRWARTISKSYQDWAKSQPVARTLEIKPFDPTLLIENTFYDAGYSQLDEVGNLIGMGVKFDLRSKEAESWIQGYAANQIKYIDAANKQAIRQIKFRAFSEGLTLQEQRPLIKQSIGLLPQHVLAVQNYKDSLLESGEDSDIASYKSAKYADRLLNYRSDMIGVTEGMEASNQGTRQANQDAIDRGIIDPEEYEQKWVTSGLGKVCDECHDANGTRAPVGGTFPNGTYGPTLHPHCACGTVLVKVDS